MTARRKAPADAPSAFKAPGYAREAKAARAAEEAAWAAQNGEVVKSWVCKACRHPFPVDSLADDCLKDGCETCQRCHPERRVRSISPEKAAPVRTGDE